MEKENLDFILCRVCLQAQSISIAPCLIIFALIQSSIFMLIFVWFFSFHHHTLITSWWQQGGAHWNLCPFSLSVLSWSSFTCVLYSPHSHFRISALVSLMSMIQCALMLQWKSSSLFRSEEPCLQLLHNGKLSCVEAVPSKISNTIHDNHRLLEGLGWKEG